MLQPLRRRVDDAHVGLVRDQPVDRRRIASRRRRALRAPTSASTFTANLNTAVPSICTNGVPLTSPRCTVPGHAQDVRDSGRRRADASRGCRARPTAPARRRRRRRRTARRCRDRSSRGCASRSRRRRPARCAPCPLATILSAMRERVDEARAHRLHVERRRRRAAPSFACRMHAVDGKIMSGVVVRDDDEVDVGRRDARGLERARARRASARSRWSARRRGDVALRGCRCARGSTRRWCRRASRARRWSGPARAGSCRCRRCGYASRHRRIGSALAARRRRRGHRGDPLRDACRARRARLRRAPCAART